jgi:hypothetical protein
MRFIPWMIEDTTAAIPIALTAHGTVATAAGAAACRAIARVGSQRTAVTTNRRKRTFVRKVEFTVCTPDVGK